MVYPVKCGKFFGDVVGRVHFLCNWPDLPLIAV